MSRAEQFVSYGGVDVQYPQYAEYQCMTETFFGASPRLQLGDSRSRLSVRASGPCLS